MQEMITSRHMTTVKMQQRGRMDAMVGLVALLFVGILQTVDTQRQNSEDNPFFWSNGVWVRRPQAIVTPTTDTYPGVDGNPEEDGNPGVDGNPEEDGNPGGDGNPEEDGNPGVDGNPEEDGNPGVDGNPEEDGNPGVDGNGQLIGCRCQATQESNLVCGTDTNNYGNMGKLRCAQRCGHKVEVLHPGSCQARDHMELKVPTPHNSDISSR